MVYLRDLAQGLVQDAPQTPGGSTEGTRRLQEQAKDAEKEYEDVTDKVGSRVIVIKKGGGFVKVSLMYSGIRYICVYQKG